MADLATVFGLLGSVCAASLFLPQVWASYTSRKTRDLAWPGIIIGILNGALWIAYGLLKSDPFIYLTNAALLVGACLLALLKKKYG